VAVVGLALGGRFAPPPRIVAGELLIDMVRASATAIRCVLCRNRSHNPPSPKL